MAREPFSHPNCPPPEIAFEEIDGAALPAHHVLSVGADDDAVAIDRHRVTEEILAYRARRYELLDQSPVVGTTDIAAVDVDLSGDGIDTAIRGADHENVAG